MIKPVLDNAGGSSSSRRPDAGHVPEKKYWSFSMRHWRQIEDFGLGGQSGSWLVSLCTRMAELCDRKLEEFMRDNDARDSFRFHQINWNGKNVPVKRSDFNWIPKNYLDNDAEYPFYQFHVSQALGRVVGFFDENQVFNIVVFDPNHNFQPSDYSDYKIRPTRFGHCQYSTLVDVADEFLGKCSVQNCDRKDGLRARLEDEIFEHYHGVVICKMSDEQHDRFRSLRDGGYATNISEIFEFGLEFYESECRSKNS